jgi:FAD/FMN-containing dehydrogenase
VAEIVKLCGVHGVPVIAFGTGTSLEGHVNAPGGGVSVDTSRMKRILAVNAEDLDCTVEAGVTRKELNEHLRDRACSSRSIPAPMPRSAAWRRRGPRAPMRCATARCARMCWR